MDTLTKKALFETVYKWWKEEQSAKEDGPEFRNEASYLHTKFRAAMELFEIMGVRYGYEAYHKERRMNELHSTM